MELSLQAKTEQRLILTQAMRQQLKILQLPRQELKDLVMEMAMDNPMLDVEFVPESSISVDHLKSLEGDIAAIKEYESGDNEPGSSAPELQIRVSDAYTELFNRSGAVRSSVDSADSGTDYTSYLSKPQTLSEYLHEQLRLRSNIEEPYLSLASYLVDCLSSSGYLEIPVSELAAELNVTEETMEEALFTLQSLDPAGVGARSLSECLLLQLMQPGRTKSAEKMGLGILVRLALTGLPLLAAHDMKSLAKALGISADEARLAAGIIVSLNPIPSRGFYQASDSALIIPDAYIYVRDKAIDIELNERALPKVRLDGYYSSLMRSQSIDSSTLNYLAAKKHEADEVITALSGRMSTLARVLECIASRQREFFISHAELRPMTRNELAATLSLSNSTVSRTVQNKYLQFEGRVIPLDAFFTNTINTESGQGISSRTVKEQLRRIIAAEDKTRPLSDAAIEGRLKEMGIDISRRTVAKYRSVLDIPPASQRKFR